MLGVGYAYFLSVETGQRKLSHPLADKITKVFGVQDIAQKNAEPQIRAATGALVPFTREEYLRYKRTRPSFWIDADYTDGETPLRVTPTPEEYGQCAAALLDAAEKQGLIRPVLFDFANWFIKNINSDAMLDSLKQSFDDLFPGELAKNDAFLALTVKWGLGVENEVLQNQARKDKAAAHAAAKRKSKQRATERRKPSNHAGTQRKKKQAR